MPSCVFICKYFQFEKIFSKANSNLFHLQMLRVNLFFFSLISEPHFFSPIPVLSIRSVPSLMCCLLQPFFFLNLSTWAITSNLFSFPYCHVFCLYSTYTSVNTYSVCVCEIICKSVIVPREDQNSQQSHDLTRPLKSYISPVAFTA